MKKILIIGQAPPAVEQQVPYDTTLLYEILSWVGIAKEEAQNLFEFEAVYDRFPGYGENGHLKPTLKQMSDHWKNTLKDKFEQYGKVIILGNVAKDFINTRIVNRERNILYLVHPSKRNSLYFKNNKELVKEKLEKFLK